MPKATSLSEVRQYFRGKPLSIDELEKFHVPTSEARGSNPVRRLESLLRSGSENTHKYQILFAGYKGCGKSTELNLLEKQLQDDFLVINYSVMEKLDPVNLHYIDLFIATMEQLFAVVEETTLHQYISEAYLASIQNWVSSKEVQEISDNHFTLEGEVGGGAGVKIAWFASFFAKFRAAAQTSKSMRETIQRTIEPKLSELVQQCNDLIHEIETHLDKVDKKDLLFIIEDLDKIPLHRAENLFYNYANQITQLDANIIFTFPIPLFYNTRYNTIANYFEECFVLPMVKINEQDGSPNAAGRGVLKTIVEKRMDLDLFEDPDHLDQMIAYSGGCIRDLFRMIVEAAENGVEFERDKITAPDYTAAFQKLKREYDQTIADKIETVEGREEVVIPVQDFYDALVDLVQSETKLPESTQVVMELRQNLTILGYNGEGWCDVHPIVKEILISRGKLPA